MEILWINENKSNKKGKFQNILYITAINTFLMTNAFQTWNSQLN